MIVFFLRSGKISCQEVDMQLYLPEGAIAREPFSLYIYIYQTVAQKINPIPFYHQSKNVDYIFFFTPHTFVFSELGMKIT